MDKKIILYAAAAGIVLATNAPALAQGDPGEGIARGVMHGIEGGDRHRDHDRRHHEHHAGTIIAIGTTTGIATVATSTGMISTRAKSDSGPPWITWRTTN